MKHLRIALLINCALLCCKTINSTELNPNGVRILEEQEKCGTFTRVKIVNGYQVKLGTRPWMALLRLRLNGEEGFACGGTLITNRFVLTAAHCFTVFELVYVRLGEHQISTEVDCRNSGKKRKCTPPVEDVGFVGIYKHAEYLQQAKGTHNDIALIKLDRSVEFKQHIKPICLPLTQELQEQADSNEEFTVTGWGTTENGTSSDVLLETKIKKYPRSNCSTLFLRDVKASQLCVGDLDKDSCRGDSGGPLADVAIYQDVQRFVQFGIVSYGAFMCGSGYPGVYTNVASFMPWIANILAEHS